MGLVGGCSHAWRLFARSRVGAATLTRVATVPLLGCIFLPSLDFWCVCVCPPRVFLCVKSGKEKKRRLLLLFHLSTLNDTVCDWVTIFPVEKVVFSQPARWGPTVDYYSSRWPFSWPSSLNLPKVKIQIKFVCVWTASQQEDKISEETDRRKKK